MKVSMFVRKTYPRIVDVFVESTQARISQPDLDCPPHDTLNLVKYTGVNILARQKKSSNSFGFFSPPSNSSLFFNFDKNFLPPRGGGEWPE